MHARIFIVDELCVTSIYRNMACPGMNDRDAALSLSTREIDAAASIYVCRFPVPVQTRFAEKGACREQPGGWIGEAEESDAPPANETS